MPNPIPGALQHGRRAWRRAALVPLRLLTLFIGLFAAFAALAWNLVTTRDLLHRQFESTQFLSQPGWRLSVRPDATPARGLRLALTDSPALEAIEQTHPGLWLSIGVAGIRSPQSTAAQYHGLAFANAATGLPAINAASETPCVWLGPRVPQGDEWIVEKSVRCRVQDAPAGWQSLSSEIEQPTLVLPIEAAALAKGQAWRRSVDTLLVAGASPCLNVSQPGGSIFRCTSFAANRSAHAEAGRTIGRWNTWVLPSSLLAALLAVLIYLQGLKPILSTEFSLRIALGADEVFAARWLIGAVLAQLGWVLLGLAIPVTALCVSLQVGLSRPDVVLCATWAAACCAFGVPLIVVGAWRTREQGLLRLGRLD